MLFRSAARNYIVYFIDKDLVAVLELRLILGVVIIVDINIGEFTLKGKPIGRYDHLNY